jgi:ketosteroid isomerase-like protein
MSRDNEEASSEAAVRAVADEELRAMESGDLAGFLKLLADDAVFFPPNSPPVAGAAVAPWIGEFLEAYRVTFETFRHEELLFLGEWAVLRTSFRWKVVSRTGQDSFLRLGTTVRTFRRTRTSVWRLAREIWNTYALS